MHLLLVQRRIWKSNCKQAISCWLSHSVMVRVNSYAFLQHNWTGIFTTSMKIINIFFWKQDCFGCCVFIADDRNIGKFKVEKIMRACPPSLFLNWWDFMFHSWTRYRGILHFSGSYNQRRKEKPARPDHGLCLTVYFVSLFFKFFEWFHMVTFNKCNISEIIIAFHLCGHDRNHCFQTYYFAFVLLPNGYFLVTFFNYLWIGSPKLEREDLLVDALLSLFPRKRIKI